MANKLQFFGFYLLAFICVNAGEFGRHGLRRVHPKDLPKAMPPSEYNITLFKFHIYDYKGTVTIRHPNAPPLVERIHAKIAWDLVHYDDDTGTIARYKMLECVEGPCASVPKGRDFFVEMRLGRQTLRALYKNETDPMPQWDFLHSVIFALTLPDDSQHKDWYAEQSPFGQCEYRFSRKTDQQHLREIRNCDFAFLNNRTSVPGPLLANYEGDVELNQNKRVNGQTHLVKGTEKFRILSPIHPKFGITVETSFRMDMTFFNESYELRFCNGTWERERCRDFLNFTDVGTNWKEIMGNMQRPEVLPLKLPVADSDASKFLRDSSEAEFEEKTAEILKERQLHHSESECSNAAERICKTSAEENLSNILRDCPPEYLTLSASRRLLNTFHNVCTEAVTELEQNQAAELLLNAYNANPIVGTLLLRAENAESTQKPQKWKYFHDAETAFLQAHPKAAAKWRQLRAFRVFTKSYHNFGIYGNSSVRTQEIRWPGIGRFLFTERLIGQNTVLLNEVDVTLQRSNDKLPLLRVSQTSNGKSVNVLGVNVDLNQKIFFIPLASLNGQIPLTGGQALQLNSKAVLSLCFQWIGDGDFRADFVVYMESDAVMNQQRVWSNIRAETQIEWKNRHLAVGDLDVRQSTRTNGKQRNRKIVYPGVSLI